MRSICFLLLKSGATLTYVLSISCGHSRCFYIYVILLRYDGKLQQAEEATLGFSRGCIRAALLPGSSEPSLVEAVQRSRLSRVGSIEIFCQISAYTGIAFGLNARNERSQKSNPKWFAVLNDVHSTQ
jgi:hypothetical protein